MADADITEKSSSKPKRKFNFIRKLKREPLFRKKLHAYILVYTESTGIHGIKYIGEKSRSIFERCIWIIFFCISLFLCIILIRDTWRKWDTTPVIVTFAKSPTSIWKIPFPALTICPQTKVRQTVYNFTDAYNRWNDGTLDEEELESFSASALVCDKDLYREGNKTANPDVIDHILSVAPPLNETLRFCWFNLKKYLCPDVFTETITEDGVCFTTNMLNERQIYKDNVYIQKQTTESENISWTPEQGYPTTAKRDTYPRRVMYDGFLGSLVLFLGDFVHDLDYVCRSQPQGFKVILHSPAELPMVNMRYYQTALNKELLISATPEMMTTSKSLKDYDPHKRECFFHDERNLHFFQNYTQQNCKVECLTNYTLSRCGCVAYHMPHEETTPICGPGSSNCILEAQYELTGQEVNSGILGLMDGNECDCLPSCTSLSYNVEISQSPLNWLKVLEGFREDVNEFPGIQYTRLTLFFKERQFITSERNELYGRADFLAQCGGLLGLFTGFTLLSLVELLYILFVRIACNIKVLGKKNWLS